MHEFWLDFISIFQLLLKGFLIGIMVSAPMGPTGILCVQRTMRKGRKYGMATGAGAAASDLFYALLTGLGMLSLIGFVENKEVLFWLKLVGSIMLFAFGFWTFRSDPKRYVRPTDNSKGNGSLLNNFFTSFIVTISNPLIVFLFVALYNMFTFVVPNILSSIVGYAAIVGGAMFWWAILTYALTRAKQNFGIRGIYRLNQLIGGIVMAVSVFYAIMTLFHLSLY